MDAVLQNYGNIMLEFLFELYIFCAFFFLKLERKQHFWLRLALGFVGVIALAFPVAWFYTLFGHIVWGRVLVYVVLFFLVTIQAKLCFEDSIWVVLFCNSMAYAAQNLMYKLFLIFWCYGEKAQWFDGWGKYFNLWYRVIYYSFLAAVVLLLYFTLVRKIVNKIHSSKLDRSLLALIMVVLVITIFLCSFEDIYFSKLCDGRENRFATVELYVLRQTGNAFSAICCFISLILASKALIERELMQEVAYLKYSIKQGQKQYEISKDTIDMINVKIHDIKYKINSVLQEQKDVPSEVIEDLRKSVRIYDSNIETGNEFLNVFITDKSLYCEQNGITLSCMVDGSKLEFMDVGDLYCLFGNIMDNALESVMKIQKREKRVINLSVKTKNNMLFIQSDNYYTGDISFKDGLPQTTKGDTQWHGFGMQSIKMIVQKYGGELSTYVVDDIFHLSILFGDISSVNVQNVK